MTEEKALLLTIKDHVDSLPPDSQAEVARVRDEIMTIVIGSDLGPLGLVLASAEVNAAE